MNNGIKIVINVVTGAAVGAAGYFLGFKIGKKKTQDWAVGEINAILEDKNKEIDILQNEQLADLSKLTPDILEQMEYGKENEVIVEDAVPVDELKVEDPNKEDPTIYEVAPKKAATRRKPRKTPFLIDDTEFDEGSDDFDRVDLSIDQYGDLYDDESEELYEYREYIGDQLVKRMLKDIEFGDAKQWFVKNEAMNMVFDITYRMTRTVE